MSIKFLKASTSMDCRTLVLLLGVLLILPVNFGRLSASGERCRSVELSPPVSLACRKGFGFCRVGVIIIFEEVYEAEAEREFRSSCATSSFSSSSSSSETVNNDDSSLDRGSPSVSAGTSFVLETVASNVSSSTCGVSSSSSSSSSSLSSRSTLSAFELVPNGSTGFGTSLLFLFSSLLIGRGGRGGAGEVCGEFEV